jgi:hypothetical protein
MHSSLSCFNAKLGMDAPPGSEVVASYRELGF